MSFDKLKFVAAAGRLYSMNWWMGVQQTTDARWTYSSDGGEMTQGGFDTSQESGIVGEHCLMLGGGIVSSVVCTEKKANPVCQNITIPLQPSKGEQ